MKKDTKLLKWYALLDLRLGVDKENNMGKQVFERFWTLTGTVRIKV